MRVRADDASCWPCVMFIFTASGHVVRQSAHGGGRQEGHGGNGVKDACGQRHAEPAERVSKRTNAQLADWEGDVGKQVVVGRDSGERETEPRMPQP